MNWPRITAVSIGALIGAAIALGHDFLTQPTREEADIEEADATPINVE